MQWDKEQAKMEQVINSHLSWNEEQAQFCERLLETLDNSVSKNSFLSKARQMAEKHPNPWQREDLIGLVDTIEEEE